MTITCKQCGAIGTIADHYTYKSRGIAVPFGKCKKCHNVGKYQKKPTGWAKLSQETVDEIREQLSDRRVKVKDVAEQFKLPTSTLQNWIKKGILD
jgi:DNA-binding transcriptional regulator YiaG